MAIYSYPDGSNRATKQKGDIRDAITNIAPDVNILLSMLQSRGTRDGYFQFPEDSFASVDLDNAHAEGADAPEAVDTSRSLASGYIQIFMKSVNVTDVQNRTAQWGIDREFSYQKGKKLVELKRDWEGITLSAQTGQAATSANGRVWKTHGMGAIITSHARDGTNDTGDNVAFDNDAFDALIEDIIADGGEPSVVLCDTGRKSAISDWTTNITRFSNEEKRLENEVLVYHAHVGPVLTIRHHTLMPVASGAPNLLVLENRYNEQRIMMDLTFKELPDRGGGPRGTWKSIWGLGSRGEKAQGQWFNC